MIFCATKEKTSWLAMELAQKGYAVEELHGDLTQQQRNFVLKKFREAELQLLIATDIAARGLDIEGVTHVISFDIPQDVTSYIHRIGRTGRAGQTGTAITFVNDKEMEKLRKIEAGIKKQLIDKKNLQEKSKPRRILKTKAANETFKKRTLKNERSSINDWSKKRSGNSVRRRTSTRNERGNQRRGK